MSAPRYPFAPLAEAMGTSELQAAKRLGISGRTRQQYRANGVSVRVADQLAVKIGRHPSEIWPEFIDDAIAEIEAAS